MRWLPSVSGGIRRPPPPLQYPETRTDDSRIVVQRTAVYISPRDRLCTHNQYDSYIADSAGCRGRNRLYQGLAANLRREHIQYINTHVHTYHTP